MALYVLVAALAYLLGSIPFGFILVLVFHGTDVRSTGSGSIGATNVARTGSKALGIATLVLDAAKGYLAVFAAIHIANSYHSMNRGLASDPKPFYLMVGLAAVFAMIGHIFPVWLKFRGGKGVATGVGVFLALVPKAVLIVLAVFVIIFAASRYVSLASIIATAAFPVVAYFYLAHQDLTLMPFIVTASILIIAKHHQNIRRLMTGTESRLELTHK